MPDTVHCCNTRWLISYRIRTRIRAGILGLLLALPLAAAEQSWIEIKTPRYTVLSQLPDAQTRRWANEFDDFIDTSLAVIGGSDKNLTPLTVLLFSGDRGFTPYKPRQPDGTVAKNVAGVFGREATWAIAGVSDRDDSSQGRRILFHEGMHWLASADPGAVPTWLNEGLAELFSTFERRPDTVNFGKPIPGHVYQLRTYNLLPMADLLSQRGSLLEKENLTQMFYAQSWLMVHYLWMSNDPGRREQWANYLRIYRTRSPSEAAREVFGEDLSALGKALQVYIGRPTMGYIRLPRPAARSLPESHPAAPLDVQLALGKLALGSADKTLSEAHATKAEQLAPQAAGVFELRAAIAKRDHDRPGMVSAARRAVAAGSSDADMYLLMADDLQRSEQSNEQSRQERIIELSELALKANPRLLQAYNLLLQALIRVEKPRPSDEGFIALGRQLFPQESMLTFGAATLARKLGRHDEALAMLGTAIDGGSGFDEFEIDRARTLRSDWLMQDLSAQVDELSRKREFAQIRARVAEVKPKASGEQAQAYLARLLVQTEITERVTEADRLRGEGKTDPARQIYQALRERSDLPPRMDDYLDRALEALKQPPARKPQK